MSKTLAKAALVVGAVAAVATGVGLVIGAAAAAATGIATVATIATAAATVLQVGAAITAKAPSTQATGSQTSFSADPDAGIPWVIGRTGTAGNIVFRSGFDTRDKGDNDRQSFVIVLSLGPCAAIEGFTADRSAIGFNVSGQAVGGFNSFMWQTRQLGALSEPALSFGAGAGTPPGWSSFHRLSGKAAATWTLRFDTKAKLYQNGVPAPMWVVRGAFCYDPRKDSTYPGGTGPHRMADPADTAAYDAAVATWEWTENPFLLGLRFVHGIWQRDIANASSKWVRVMGMGAPQAGIDVSSYVEGANVADANGWKAGGVIYSGDNKWESLKKILQAGMGEPLALGAKIGCLVNAPKVSLATIGADDVVGEASVGATQPRRTRINTITPRYRLEANNWVALPGSPITVAEHVATDGGRRSKVQDYWFIQDSGQVGTAVRYDIENAREFGPIVLPLKLYWMGYKPGDCVTATLPELGLNAQPILLRNRSLGPADGIVTMTARSETPAKHAFALGQVATPPPTPGVTGAPVVPVPAADAWAITGLELVSGATSVPALIVTGAVDAATADAVVFEYRPFANGQDIEAGWSAAGIEPPTVTRKEIVSVTGGTQYEVSVRNRARGVLSGRRILGPVSTAVATGLEGPPGQDGADGRDGRDGTDGTDGLNGKDGRDGNNGADGRTPQFHFAWANSLSGTVDFTTGEQGGRIFQGVYVDYDAGEDSADPARYTWSRYTGQDGKDGTDGIEGPPGEDGRPSYVHKAYSNSPNGSVDFSRTDPDGRAYLGLYIDFTQADSTDPAAYAWSLIKGVDAITIEPSAASVTFFADYLGTLKPNQLGQTVRMAFTRGAADVSSQTAWTVEGSACAPAISAVGVVSFSAVTGDGEIRVTGVHQGVTRLKKVPVTLAKDNPPANEDTKQSRTVSIGVGVDQFPSTAASGGLPVRAGPGGSIKFEFSGSYSANSAGNVTLQGIFAYRLSGSSDPFTYLSAGAVNGTRARYRTGPGGDPIDEAGSLVMQQSQGGMTAGTLYDTGLFLRRVDGTVIAIGGGTMTVTGE